MQGIDSLIKKNKEFLVFAAALAGYCVAAYCLQIPCPIKYVTGISCPGCGMTRSVFSLCSLNVQAAMYYHPLVFYVLLLIPCLIVFHKRKMAEAQKIAVAVSAVLFIAVYIYRLFIVPSPVLECAPEKAMWVRLFRWALQLG